MRSIFAAGIQSAGMRPAGRACAAGAPLPDGADIAPAPPQSVMRLLDDAEWSLWSDREIARQCKVSPHTVASLRPKPVVTVQTHSQTDKRNYTTRHGTVAKMKTKAINADRQGKAPATREQPAKPEPPAHSPTNLMQAVQQGRQRVGRATSFGAQGPRKPFRL